MCCGRLSPQLFSPKGNMIFRSGVKGALYIIWCGVNRLGDSGVKVVSIDSAILQLLLSRRVIYC